MIVTLVAVTYKSPTFILIPCSAWQYRGHYQQNYVLVCFWRGIRIDKLVFALSLLAAWFSPILPRTAQRIINLFVWCDVVYCSAIGRSGMENLFNLKELYNRYANVVITVI